MNIQEVKEKGVFLGFCPVEGYVYSIPHSIDHYIIVSFRCGKIKELIRFKVYEKDTYLTKEENGK